MYIPTVSWGIAGAAPIFNIKPGYTHRWGMKFLPGSKPTILIMRLPQNEVYVVLNPDHGAGCDRLSMFCHSSPQ